MAPYRTETLDPTHANCYLRHCTGLQHHAAAFGLGVRYFRAVADIRFPLRLMHTQTQGAKQTQQA